MSPTTLDGRPIALTAMVAAVVPAAVFTNPADGSEVITFRSGAGAIGQPDPAYHFASGNGPFTTANFAAARAGAAATIVAPYIYPPDPNNHWLFALPSDAQAKWIAVNANRPPTSGLYAYDFQIAATTICNASLVIHFAVDDGLGRVGVPGLYLNGQAIPNVPTNVVGYRQEYTIASDAIGALLHAGLNTLYFYQHDIAGVVAGSLFSGQIVVNGSPIPAGQPAPAAACASGTASFSVTPVGTGPFGYQWQIESSPGVWQNLTTSPAALPCGGTAFATVPSGAATQIGIRACPGISAYTVRCVVTNPCGTFPSSGAAYTVCYANCDCSSGAPALNVNDFVCFQQRFAAADPYADCDRNNALNVLDFVCFQQGFAAGCP